MARKTDADKTIVFGSNPIFLDIYKQLGCHCKSYNTSWCLQNENRLLVITNGHFINEQILRTPSMCIPLIEQNGLQMARKTEADKPIVFGRH